jgi:hypothetical protein
MKKIIISTFIFAFSLLVITLGSCTKKGDMGPAGQQGAQGAAGAVSLKTDGYIKGTLTGMRRDGTLFSETFSYSSCLFEESYIDSVSPTQYDFYILRTVDAVDQSGAKLMLSAISLSPINIASTGLDFSLIKSIGTKGFYFGLTSTVAPSLSNVTYDRITGIVTGNFIVNILGTENVTGNAANITGSFKATVPVLHF